MERHRRLLHNKEDSNHATRHRLYKKDLKSCDETTEETQVMEPDMLLPTGTHYRTKTTSTGKRVRLAFQGKTVIEAKNIQTGATHSPQDFERDKVQAHVKRHYQRRAERGL